MMSSRARGKSAGLRGAAVTATSAACLLVFALACPVDPETNSSEPSAEERLEGSDISQLDGFEAQSQPRQRASQPPGFTAAQAAEFAQLQAIGYLDGYISPTEWISVTAHDTARAYRGFNFYTSGHGPEAILMDMNGEVLHRWAKSVEEVWPGRKIDPKFRAAHYYRRAALLPNGDILAIIASHGLIKLDKHSKLLWAYDRLVHHDLDVLADGRIATLTREIHIRKDVNPTRPIVEDFVVILSPDGEELVKLSILDAFRNAAPEFSELIAAMPTSGDLMHTNSVEVLDGRIDRLPAFAKGNLLLSFRQQSTLAVLDLSQQKIVWAKRGPWKAQHDPHVLDDRRILLFNNLAGRSGGVKISAVIEFDVVAEKLVWSHQGSESRPFFSPAAGAVQRLPNGNTLIIESRNGRGFEVSANHDLVWEFYSPHRAGKHKELVSTLLDMVRLPPDFPLDWIPNAVEQTRGGASSTRTALGGDN